MIGTNLRKLRISRQLSQEILAKIARIPRTAYVQIETGKRKLMATELRYICIALGVSADMLLAEDSQ